MQFDDLGKEVGVTDLGQPGTLLCGGKTGKIIYFFPVEADDAVTGFVGAAESSPGTLAKDISPIPAGDERSSVNVSLSKKNMPVPNFMDEYKC